MGQNIAHITDAPTLREQPLIPSRRDNAVMKDAIIGSCEYLESAITHDLPDGAASDLHAALFILYGIEEVLT